VLGAVLMIVSPNSRVNRILLSNRAMVWIGLISYPLYLWHWPLLSYLATLRNGVPNPLEIWAVVLVAITLSWLTYRFVEIPLRRQRNAAPGLSFGLIAIGIAGIVTAISSGFDFRFPPEVRDIAALASYNNAGFNTGCFLEGPVTHFDSRCVEPGDKPLLFLWGDSTAAALYPGLKKAEETVPFRLARFSAPACAPILATGLSKRCDGLNNVAFGFLKSSLPSIVLLHAIWDIRNDENNDLDRLRETIRQLKEIGIPRIVILGPVPLWKRTLPHALINFYRFRHIIADRIATGVSGPQNDEIMEAFSKSVGVEYISAWHALCNTDGCLTRAGPTADDVITTDLVHLSDAGSRFLIKTIGRRLFAGM
jgi:hypothetical protein